MTNAPRVSYQKPGFSKKPGFSSPRPPFPASLHLRVALLLLLVLAPQPLLAQGPTIPTVPATQPYRVEEYPIEELREPSRSIPFGFESTGSRVAWQAENKEVDFYDVDARAFWALHLEHWAHSIALTDEALYTIESDDLRSSGVFGYRLKTRDRFVVWDWKNEDLRALSASGNSVVWVEGQKDRYRLYRKDLASGQTSLITSQDRPIWSTDVFGDFVVWSVGRDSGGSAGCSRSAWMLGAQGDYYGYRLSTGQEYRITRESGCLLYNQLAMTEHTFVFASAGSKAMLDSQVISYDLSSGQAKVLAEIPTGLDVQGLSADRDVVVWAAGPSWGDTLIYGYDLALDQPFIVSRAVGQKRAPAIARKTVVWWDGRYSTPDKYGMTYKVYAARLSGESSPPPAMIGAIHNADVKIERLWPESGRPGIGYPRAVVSMLLFCPGTFRTPLPIWNPGVQLWQALDNGPATVVSKGFAVMRGPYTTWDAFGVNTFPAMDPNRKLYYFATLDTVPSRTNVWAHAADARTHFPYQDRPVTIGPLGQTVDARIEIVWPHGFAPVDRAARVNVTAMLFQPGTFASAPADSDARVHLWRSLDADVGEDIGVGIKRIVKASGFEYPVWDWNDVDVSSARDPAHKYFFRLTVEGVETHSNIWGHGAAAGGTYFPIGDQPGQVGCQ